MFDFSDKAVVVTGGTKGIGRSIAEHFFAAGAMVSVCSRRETDVRQAVAQIGATDPSRILGMAADTSKKDRLDRFLDGAIERFGRIDIMVNNAGLQFPQPTEDMNEAEYDLTLATNLKGYFFGSQYAARDMMRRNAGGCIVNIGSVHAQICGMDQTAYAASKAGVSQMTRTMARQWGEHGIRVNCVAPGSIPTNINAAIYADPAAEKALNAKLPLGRRGRLEEIANPVMFMASDLASYVTGQTLYVDGGFTVVHG